MSSRFSELLDSLAGKWDDPFAPGIKLASLRSEGKPIAAATGKPCGMQFTRLLDGLPCIDDGTYSTTTTERNFRQKQESLKESIVCIPPLHHRNFGQGLGTYDVPDMSLLRRALQGGEDSIAEGENPDSGGTGTTALVDVMLDCQCKCGLEMPTTRLLGHMLRDCERRESQCITCAATLEHWQIAAHRCWEHGLTHAAGSPRRSSFSGLAVPSDSLGPSLARGRRGSLLRVRNLCPNGCGEELAEESDSDGLAPHMSVCPRRRQLCSRCDESLEAWELPDHRCRFSVVKSVMTGDDLESVIDGLAMAAVKRKRSISAALAIDCPSGCGMVVPAVALQLHASQHCPQRPLLCTMGCGFQFSAHMLPGHVSECTARPLSASERQAVGADQAKEEQLARRRESISLMRERRRSIVDLEADSRAEDLARREELASQAEEAALVARLADVEAEAVAAEQEMRLKIGVVMEKAAHKRHEELKEARLERQKPRAFIIQAAARLKQSVKERACKRGLRKRNRHVDTAVDDALTWKPVRVYRRAWQEEVPAVAASKVIKQAESSEAQVLRLLSSVVLREELEPDSSVHKVDGVESFLHRATKARKAREETAKMMSSPHPIAAERHWNISTSLAGDEIRKPTLRYQIHRHDDPFSHHPGLAIVGEAAPKSNQDSLASNMLRNEVRLLLANDSISGGDSVVRLGEGSLTGSGVEWPLRPEGSPASGVPSRPPPPTMKALSRAVASVLSGLAEDRETRGLAEYAEADPARPVASPARRKSDARAAPKRFSFRESLRNTTTHTN